VVHAKEIRSAPERYWQSTSSKTTTPAPALAFGRTPSSVIAFGFVTLPVIDVAVRALMFAQTVEAGV
jgi:hypothetical protein